MVQPKRCGPSCSYMPGAPHTVGDGAEAWTRSPHAPPGAELPGLLCSEERPCLEVGDDSAKGHRCFYFLLFDSVAEPVF